MVSFHHVTTILLFVPFNIFLFTWTCTRTSLWPRLSFILGHLVVIVSRYTLLLADFPRTITSKSPVGLERLFFTSNPLLQLANSYVYNEFGWPAAVKNNFPLFRPVRLVSRPCTRLTPTYPHTHTNIPTRTWSNILHSSGACRFSRHAQPW